jgi:hypothetical protein
VIFVNGLAGIPGLLVEQVQGAFASQMRDSHRAPSYSHGDRTVRLHLPGPAGVTVTAWWQTSFVPPDPKSDSRVLLDQRLDGGEHTVAIPDDVPTRAAFVTARVDANTYAFSIAAES